VRLSSTPDTGEHDDIDLDRVDLFDARLYSDGDPHAIWRALRRTSPVRWQSLEDGRGFWNVTRYDDVRRVLRDHAAFTSEGGNLLSMLGRPDPAAGAMVTSTDPPRHQVLREPLTRCITPQAIGRQERRIREGIRRFLAPLVSEDSWNVAAAATELPMAFTGALLGVPESDWPMLARWTMAAVAPEDPWYHDGNSRLVAAEAHYGLFEYFSEQVRHRGAAAPSDDIIGGLMSAEVDGKGLTPDEIVYNCYSMTLGANGTAPHVIAATVQALAENPDEHRRLAEHPELLPSAVEEGFRWSSPANHFLRHAVTDVTLSGVRIAAGDPVVVWMGSANRDETVFADPYRFDVGRNPNRHIAFGVGPHYCVGAPLARSALTMLFAELIALVEVFEIVGPVQHLRTNVVAGIADLPVRARLRAGRAVLPAASGGRPC